MTSAIIILATIACTLCLGSIFILCRYAEPSRSHRSLIVMIAMWFFVVVYGATQIVVSGEMLSFGITILDTRLLMRSYISIFPFILYLISLFDERVLRLRNIVVILSPAIVVTALYFGWHWISDESYDVVYHSYDELWESRRSVSLALRLLMMCGIMFYIYGAVSFVWSLVYRLKVYCVDISRVVVNALSLVTISLAFLYNLLFHSDISIVIYIVVGIFAFTLIVDNAMFYKEIELPSTIGVEWRFPLQWRLIEREVVHDITESESVSAFALFNQWLSLSKPFCNHSFSIKDVESKFTPEQCVDISLAIRSAGYNFQSYIRMIRVNEAISIMKSRADISTTQLAEMVGFSHISSFSRAFHAVTQKSPSEFRES